MGSWRSAKQGQTTIGSVLVCQPDRQGSNRLSKVSRGLPHQLLQADLELGDEDLLWTGQAWGQLRDTREQAFPMGHDAPRTRVGKLKHGEPEVSRADPFPD